MGLFDSYKKKSLVKKATNLMTQKEHQSVDDFKKALKLVNKALELDPDYALAWNLKGNAFIGLAEPDMGVKCLDKAIELDPELGLPWYGKGMVSQTLGKYEEAMEYYNKALKIEDFGTGKISDFAVQETSFPSTCKNQRFLRLRSGASQTSKSELANLRFALRNHRFREISKDLDLGLKNFDKFHKDVLYRKGVVLTKLGRYKEAIGQLDKSLKLNPKNSEAWFNKGLTFLQLGKFEESLNCFEKTLNLNSKNAHAWIGKGISLEKLEKPEDALKCYKKALELEPDSEFAKKAKKNILTSKS